MVGLQGWLQASQHQHNGKSYLHPSIGYRRPIHDANPLEFFKSSEAEQQYETNALHRQSVLQDTASSACLIKDRKDERPTLSLLKRPVRTLYETWRIGTILIGWKERIASMVYGSPTISSTHPCKVPSLPFKWSPPPSSDHQPHQAGLTSASPVLCLEENSKTKEIKTKEFKTKGFKTRSQVSAERPTQEAPPSEAHQVGVVLLLVRSDGLGDPPVWPRLESLNTRTLHKVD
jgi:hypothetical protein